MQMIKLKHYRCVQNYLERHAKYRKFTRWEHCVNKHCRPGYWVVYVQLASTQE